MDENVFSDSYPDYITLHVPEKSVTQYKNASPWNSFYDVVPIDYIATDIPGAPKCGKPTISYSKGQLVMSCATEGVEYITDISDTDIKQHYSPTITLSATYEIRVYATRQGYNNSEIVTATLCWIDKEPQTGGIENSIGDISAQPVLIQSYDGTFTIDGLDDDMQVRIYTTDGMLSGSALSQNGIATINTHLPAGSIAIVKMGQKSVKVVVK